MGLREVLKGRAYFDRRDIAGDLAAGVTLGIETSPTRWPPACWPASTRSTPCTRSCWQHPVGALFASSVFMSVQTTSALSLLVADVPSAHGEDAAGALFMLAILTGAIMLAAGLLRLGRYLRFVPNAVLVGFINGVALLIILGQLGDLTGTSPQGPNKVVKTWTC